MTLTVRRVLTESFILNVVARVHLVDVDDHEGVELYESAPRSLYVLSCPTELTKRQFESRSETSAESCALRR
ncbi:uncharacterized protein PHALS_09269 [Plasmopara halstedii]|uniref:Uncharacterized protein n=1 Tax=Plasmopara halstedii TaxID=4781 RepID=A0A0P1ADW1_PLAHL|nr:uncharacterized protein PHALS_09269 [Plasmopara halstedii]CEG39215.1 hypothetical protein PHALS_09269 [Plasmopara halstedii]|eukprot:XP_024575584.1 hypothetical protein PHALS_09269 [Plasmopara halstedii]